MEKALRAEGLSYLRSTLFPKTFHIYTSNVYQLTKQFACEEIFAPTYSKKIMHGPWWAVSFEKWLNVGGKHGGENIEISLFNTFAQTKPTFTGGAPTYGQNKQFASMTTVPPKMAQAGQLAGADFGNMHVRRDAENISVFGNKLG